MAPLDLKCNLKYLVNSFRVNYSSICKNIFVTCMSYCDNCLYNVCSCIAGFFRILGQILLGQFFLEL